MVIYGCQELFVIFLYFYHLCFSPAIQIHGKPAVNPGRRIHSDHVTSRFMHNTV